MTLTQSVLKSLLVEAVASANVSIHTLNIPSFKYLVCILGFCAVSIVYIHGFSAPIYFVQYELKCIIQKVKK